MQPTAILSLLLPFPPGHKVDDPFVLGAPKIFDMHKQQFDVATLNRDVTKEFVLTITPSGVFVSEAHA